MSRQIVLFALIAILSVAYAADTTACYTGQPKGANTTVSATKNAQATWYSSTCCGTNFTMDTFFDAPLGKCVWGFRGNFSKDNTSYNWNVTSVYMRNFSTGCKEQLILFFYGLYCSPNFAEYIVVNESSLLNEQVGITSMHVCSRSINRLFVACSDEIVPAGMAGGNGYNPDVGLMACANFTEVFPTAIDLLKFFSYYSLETPFIPDSVNQPGWTPATNITVPRVTDFNFTSSEIVPLSFNPFSYPLRYDQISTKTCFAGANNLSAPMAIILAALFLLSLITLF